MLDKNNTLIYKALHYFVVDLDYEVVVVKGLDNELWLQNLSEEYKLIRFVFTPIINQEQLVMDIRKAAIVSKTIRNKMLSLKMKTMTFYFNIANNLKMPEVKNQALIPVKKMEDITKSDTVKEFFPNINKKMQFDETGIELFLKINSDIQEKNARTNDEYNKIFMDKTPFVTYILMAINFVIFIVGLMNSGSLTQTSTDFINTFGNQNTLVYKYHEYFRLLSSAFIHVDLLHLTLNSFVLYSFGKRLESHLGPWKFFLIYFFSAISSSLLSICFHDNFTVGASGAIFGILGALLYFGYYYRAYLSRMLLEEIIPIIILNIAIGFMGSNIDNFAHLGGLIGGVIMTMALGVSNKSSKVSRINGWIISILMIAFFIFLGLKRVEII